MSTSHPTRRRRRQHAPEFKQGVVALCQLGVSTSAVALTHGINANLQHRWIKQFHGGQSSHAITAPAKLVPIEVDLSADAPVDMRWSIDRLSLLIQQIDDRSPCDGTAYGFTNRNYSRLKLLT